MCDEHRLPETEAPPWDNSCLNSSEVQQITALKATDDELGEQLALQRPEQLAAAWNQWRFNHTICKTEMVYVNLWVSA